MSVNLVNVYDFLIRKYGDRFISTYSMPPTYILEILGAEDTSNKIIHCYCEKRKNYEQNSLSLETKSKSDTSTHSELDLNLTGSPLKDDYLSNTLKEIAIDDDVVVEEFDTWAYEERHHCGMKTDKAREIICSDAFQSIEFADQRGDVWFLCNGGASKTILLQREFCQGYFSRGIVYFEGMVPAGKVNYQALLKRCLPITSVETKPQFESLVENIYHIRENIELRCTYSWNSTLPVLNDLSNCDITLRQTFKLSDSDELLQDLLNQVRMLNYIRDDIIDYHKSLEAGYAKEPIYRCGRGIDLEELRTNIHKAMTEVTVNVQPDSDNQKEIELAEVLLGASNRSLFELTDKLWDILKCCSTYEDLKMAFSMLFQCTLRYNIVNVPTNKNRLAEIITELTNHRLAVPCLSGAEPLELLFEIGVEKIFKDYEYIFTVGRICSNNLLKYNPPKIQHETVEVSPGLNMRKSLHRVPLAETTNARKTLLQYNAKPVDKSPEQKVAGFKNSNFDEGISAGQMAKLLQVHCTLEHLILLQSNLKQNSLHGYISEHLLRQEPRHVELIDESFTDLMEIKLEPHFVRDHLDGKDPTTRRISIATNEGKTTYFFTINNVLPPALARTVLPTVPNEGKNKNNDGTNIIYFSYIYRKWKTQTS